MYRRAGGRERDQWSLTGYREHFIAHVAMLNLAPLIPLLDSSTFTLYNLYCNQDSAAKLCE